VTALRWSSRSGPVGWPFRWPSAAFPSPASSCPGLDTYDVLHQQVVSHHFRFGGGTQAELFRSPHRYIWPAELDLMAQLAGFELESRHADWTGTEFTAESRSHVSVYRIPTVHPLDHLDHLDAGAQPPPAQAGTAAGPPDRST